VTLGGVTLTPKEAQGNSKRAKSSQKLSMEMVTLSQFLRLVTIRDWLITECDNSGNATCGIFSWCWCDEWDESDLIGKR